MSRVLITGLNGFCGRYLNQELMNRDIETIGLSRLPSSGKTTSFVADICDPDQIARVIDHIRPTYVVHLAGISSPAHDNQLELFRTNTLGTLTLLECLASKKFSIEKVVLASSANVYGKPAVEILDESLCPEPINVYGASKLAMEYLAKNYWDRLPIQIVRPFNFTGVGQTDKFLIPRIVEHFCNHRDSIELGNIDITRDFSDVRDVARFLADILLGEPAYDVVNVCSGKFISILKIIESCENLTGQSMRVKINPNFIRKNEILRLRGCKLRLDSLVSNTGRIPFEQTLDWMLSASPEL